VFAAIDEATAAELKPDANTTGLIMQRTIKAMTAAAGIFVPDLQGVAVLGGSLSRDPYRLQYLRELPTLAAETKLTNFTGLPLAEQAAHAAALPDKTAILYTSLFIDDEGTRYSSRDALTAIAKVANRPIVVDVESLVGVGATGGFALDNVAYGEEVAALVLRILNGASVAAIPVAVSALLSRCSIGANFKGGTSVRVLSQLQVRYDFARQACGNNFPRKCWQHLPYVSVS